MSKRFSAGVVVVRRGSTAEGREWLFLLLRAYKNWDFPKGLMEPGEEPLATAIRETQEESSIDDLDFRFGHGYCETKPYAGGKVARYYLAETRKRDLILPVNPELGHPEHHEYRWIRYKEARALLPKRLLPVLDWAWALLIPAIPGNTP